mgnify:FL=1
MTQESVNVVDIDGNGLPDTLERAWELVLELTNSFLRTHDKFGFELVEKKSNPSLEDMLLSLKVMGGILNSLDDSGVFDGSEQRKLLNAKQQIVWFESATLALKEKDQAGYESVIAMMKNQAQF